MVRAQCLRLSERFFHCHCNHVPPESDNLSVRGDTENRRHTREVSSRRDEQQRAPPHCDQVSVVRISVSMHHQNT